jgi:hypothetical protein
MSRPQRSAPWLVPALALMLAAMPAWLDVEVRLPRPLARELELVVVSEAPRPLAPSIDAPLITVSLPPMTTTEPDAE